MSVRGFLLTICVVCCTFKSICAESILGEHLAVDAASFLPVISQLGFPHCLEEDCSEHEIPYPGRTEQNGITMPKTEVIQEPWIADEHYTGVESIEEIIAEDEHGYRESPDEVNPDSEREYSKFSDKIINKDQYLSPPLIGSIRGIPGVHYPNYKEIPITSFSCADKKYIPGFYADLETGCQVFHVCYEHRRESFLCPVGTVFNQPILACDYWYSSNCSLAPIYYEVNAKEEVKEEEVDVAVKELITALIEDKKDIAEETTGDHKKSKPYEDLVDIKKLLPVKAKVTEFAKPLAKEPKIVSMEKPKIQDVEGVASQIFEKIISTAANVISKTRDAIDKIPEPTIPEIEKPIPVFVPEKDKVVPMYKIKPIPVFKPKDKVLPVYKIKPVPVGAKLAKAAVPIAKGKLAVAVPIAKAAVAKTALPIIAKTKLAAAAIPVKAKVAAIPFAAKAAAAIPVKAKVAVLPIAAKVAAAVPAKVKAAVAIPVMATAKKASVIPVAKIAAVKASVPVAAKTKVAAAVPKVAVLKAKMIASALPLAKSKIVAPALKGKVLKTASVPFVKAKMFTVPLAKSKLAAPVPIAKAKLVKAAVISPLTKKALALGYMKLLKAKKLHLMG